ncbi:AI-2E family transporter [Klebsiella pneumoniae subsp. pneumoniae]|nr:AI-2E family transporter [Klebsiella pneumoniae subsp. pneumoniae]
MQPFILSFAWAGTVVIATWPVLLRLQRVLFGKRLLAVLAMTLLLFLLFVIPIALLVNSLVDNSVPLIKLISSGNAGRCRISPGSTAYRWSAINCVLRLARSAGYGRLGDYGQGSSLYWHHHQLVCRSGGALGKLLVYCGLMLLFSALLYWRGEQVAYGFRYFATRLAAKRGDRRGAAGRPGRARRGAGRGGHCPHSRRYWAGLALPSPACPTPLC